ncbi:hypothetical protein [Streptomyces curacoi]|uniref:Extensin n=1 Tax=Streptomyces curacoi TaxID=146536 RepID=A0A124H132_9ACTN|nr:hypothetical protein [Streptomyces curacoi]KUM74731.1 hypothetical protein AQI70_18020 [Streptomyces curacoi]
MADEQYRWLDRETAERLLRGESLEAVDAADRDEAERLAKTLGALTVEPPLSSGELPGEAAALAAFRAARADRGEASVTDGHRAASAASHAPDAGLVRIGAPARAARRPRWGRPVRLGLAAALAAGMVGGVAVAAGTGVLPTPFDEDERGRPAASVSAAVPSERTLVSPSPGTGALGEPTPGGDSKAPEDSGTAEETAPGNSATDRGSAADDRNQPSGGWWKAVASSCRDVRDGKQLSTDRRRALENAAGSSARVWKYCKDVLAGAGESTEEQPDKGKGDTGESGDQGGKGDDEGHPAGSGGNSNGNANGGSNNHRADGAAETPSTATRLTPDRTLPSATTPPPSASYSAL